MNLQMKSVQLFISFAIQNTNHKFDLIVLKLLLIVWDVELHPCQNQPISSATKYESSVKPP